MGAIPPIPGGGGPQPGAPAGDGELVGGEAHLMDRERLVPAGGRSNRSERIRNGHRQGRSRGSSESPQ